MSQTSLRCSSCLDFSFLSCCLILFFPACLVPSQLSSWRVLKALTFFFPAAASPHYPIARSRPWSQFCVGCRCGVRGYVRWLVSALTRLRLMRSGCFVSAVCRGVTPAERERVHCNNRLIQSVVLREIKVWFNSDNTVHYHPLEGWSAEGDVWEETEVWSFTQWLMRDSETCNVVTGHLLVFDQVPSLFWIFGRCHFFPYSFAQAPGSKPVSQTSRKVSGAPCQGESACFLFFFCLIFLCKPPLFSGLDFFFGLCSEKRNLVVVLQIVTLEDPQSLHCLSLWLKTLWLADTLSLDVRGCQTLVFSKSS